jgi:Flp pilus assembly protein TadG
MTARARAGLTRLKGSKRGNVAIIFGVSVLPLVFVAGMGMDYTTAVSKEDALNAIADAAALAALRPQMLAQSDQASVDAATSTFNAQALTMPGITYDAKNLNVAVTDVTSGVSVKRTINITYTAASPNAFMGVLGQPSIALSGGSQATAAAAPNINFYLMLDDSPSMAIAASQADINTMVAHTTSQGGCAFGCHQQTGASSLGNAGGVDNYQLARNLQVTLRIDLLRQATQNLMTTAKQVSQTDNAQYQMAIYTFDLGVNTIQTLTSDLTTAAAQAANITTLEVYSQNCVTQSNCNNDTDTNFDNAFTKMSNLMPAPGNGTNAAGDTPQEVLFLVTDGVEDEVVSGASACPSTVTMASGNRCQSMIKTSNCDAIKNRGIRIAVLYTTYYPLPTNAWYNQYLKPIQSQIGPTLETCASPGLYFEVQTGGDISSAMSALFQQAVATAYLSR